MSKECTDNKQVTDVNRSLTEIEKQKVEKNNKLIEGFLHKYKLDRDTYYGAAAEGLIQAVKRFDENRGSSFSTYAYAVMRSYCFMFYNRVEKEFSSTVSLDATLSDKTGESSSLVHLDTFATDSNTPSNMLLYIEYIEKIKVFDSSELELLIGLLDGKKMSEMALDYGLTRSRIQAKVAKMRKKLITAEGMNNVILKSMQNKFIQQDKYTENYNKACKKLSKIIFNY